MTNTARVTGDHPHTDPGDGRQECGRCGKWVFPVIHSCKGVPVTAAARARMGMDTAPTAADPIQVERERIRRILALPLLQALRLIPSGRIQQGCVVSDGDAVRSNLKAAYHAVNDGTPAPTVPLDLVEVAPWLEVCGSCDAGLPQSCTCPTGDVRLLIAGLVDEIVRLRQHAATVEAGW
ncbi:hypothetical protein [Micromonospora sp. NBC_00421]|uniref:hypothetical protein n=1 Tax=Micromonospora sp. NBC_00421 TaxID=2975976 RepID=UPI002E23C994